MTHDQLNLCLTLGYGLWAFLTCIASWRSKDAALFKLSAILLGGWALTNVFEGFLGFARAPVLLGAIDALAAAYVTWIAVDKAMTRLGRNSAPRSIAAAVPGHEARYTSSGS